MRNGTVPHFIGTTSRHSTNYYSGSANRAPSRPQLCKKKRYIKWVFVESSG